MIPHSRFAVFALAVLGFSAFAGPPPEPSIPENVTPFTSSPAPSGITPYALPQNPTPQNTRPLPSAPPAPAITMLVLVPQDVPSGGIVPYEIRVTNNSTADASRVRVRMPLPEKCVLESADPQPVPGNELVWEIKSLPRGETRKIELKLKTNASEVTAKAYVSYEFGQSVKTRLSSPKLKVQTELPRELTTADETIPVRVRITNDGRVPVEKVKLTETISDGFEFDKSSSGERTASALTQTWDLGTIPPGTGKTVEYRVVPKLGKELLVRSNVDGGGQQDSHEGRVKIQDAKLRLELRADGQPSDAEANFKATVKNEGTTTLTNVRVLGSVPQDCKVTSRTNGGQLSRDGVSWVIPKLAPGDGYTLKWRLASSSGGRKNVRAEAVSDRGLKDAQAVETIFAGVASLTWDTRFDSATVGVDKTGMFTVKVANSGGEPAKNTKVVVQIPPGVSFVQASPKHTHENGIVTFDTREIRPGSSETFSLTFRGERTGAAYFVSKLSGEALGDKPMTAEKYVQITSR